MAGGGGGDFTVSSCDNLTSVVTLHFVEFVELPTIDATSWSHGSDSTIYRCNIMESLYGLHHIKVQHPGVTVRTPPYIGATSWSHCSDSTI